MEQFTKAVILIALSSSLLIGENSQADSSLVVQAHYLQHAIYLQDALFIFNYKIIQNGIEYRAGTHFKNLPDFMTESTEIRELAIYAIEKRQAVDRIVFIGMPFSLFALFKGINDQNGLLAQVGLFSNLVYPFLTEGGNIRLKNELTRLIHEYNASLLN